MQGGGASRSKSAIVSSMRIPGAMVTLVSLPEVFSAERSKTAAPVPQVLLDLAYASVLLSIATYDLAQLLVPQFSVEPCRLLCLNSAGLRKRNVCQQLTFPSYVWVFIHRCNESCQPTTRGVLPVTPAANLANKAAHASTSPSSFMPSANPHAYLCSTTRALPNHWASD
jgi:hypothetical protein